jgi:hypothetical protein
MGPKTESILAAFNGDKTFFHRTEANFRFAGTSTLSL